MKKKINESNTNLAKQRVQLTNKLITEINPILANYSNENSISLIIQKKNIIIGKKELDITDEVIKLLDKKIKKINLN